MQAYIHGKKDYDVECNMTEIENIDFLQFPKLETGLLTILVNLLV